LTALAACGLPTDEFRFIGFLPSKTTARRKALETLAHETATLIAYESPHRILETLADIAEILAGRRVVLARELTKIHEEFLRGTAADIREQLQQQNVVKGEMTVLVARSEQTAKFADPRAEIQRLEHQGLDRMEAIKTVAKQMGLPKRELYRLVTDQGSSLADTQED
jgi:16S rRNA (cytidine1402-2'-O)-methyltransferase